MDGNARGVGVLSLGPDGEPAWAGVAAEMSSPSYLAESAGVVYAADEAGGRVEAFRRSGSSLAPLGGQPTSGTAPCQLTVVGDRLCVANYGSGEIDVFPLRPDGSIGLRTQSIAGTGSGPHPAQDGPHAHATMSLGELAITADLGGDTIGIHRWHDGVLHPVGSIRAPAGTGPRDFCVAPDGRIWVLGELSGQVFELWLPASGPPRLSDGIAVAVRPVADDHAAALVASGRFLYTGLRGSDRIAVIDTRLGRAVADVACGGSWPRHLLIAGGRLYVACQGSDSVTVFELDESSGIPRQVAGVTVPTPTHLLEVAEISR